MKKKLFILSSKSGSTEFDIKKEYIEDVYRKYNKLDEIEIVVTNHANHTVEVSKDFAKENSKDKTIIVCGGDGTLNEIVNAVYQTDVSVGLIPTGTGNDFSKNFNYKNFKIEDTLNTQSKEIDLIKVNDKICINVMSLGFDTIILSNAYKFLKKNPKLGKKSYIKSVIYSLRHIEYEDLELDLLTKDNEKIHVKNQFLLSALCNGGYYGSGFNPAPRAILDDGILHLVTIDKIPLLALIPSILKYKKGEHTSLKYANEFLVKSGRIKSKDKFMANIDGEIFETNQIDFKVLEKKIKWAYFKK